MRSYNHLVDALEARAKQEYKTARESLDWVLLEDAADVIKVLSGQRHLDRILASDTADRLAQTLDRLLFIQNVIDSDPDVSVDWIYTEIEGLLSGEKA